MWNNASSRRDGDHVPITTRRFQIIDVQDSVLECVSWDDTTQTAGSDDFSVYIVKPDLLQDMNESPPYSEDDIITARLLAQPIDITLDDDTDLSVVWQDTNTDGRSTGTTEHIAQILFLHDVDVTTMQGSLADGIFCLVVNQTDPTENGLYVYHDTADWTKLDLQDGEPVTLKVLGSDTTYTKNYNNGSIWINHTIPQGDDPDIYRILPLQDNTISVQAMTTDSITYSGEQNLDDVDLIEGDLAFCAQQSSNSANGAYIVSTEDWIQLPAPVSVLISNGTENGKTVWFRDSEVVNPFLYNQGAVGPTGLTGVTGMIGVTGTQGARGVGILADYASPPLEGGVFGQIYVDLLNGFTYQWDGSVWQFTFSMIGATGASVNGATGIQGIMGVTGASITGASGATGIQGLQGQTGLMGVTGQTGPQGTPGTNGFNGVQGATGAGIQGVTGLAGVTGADGADGDDGLDGSQGVTGLVGATGASIVGVTGLIGATGADGADGDDGLDGSQGVTGLRGFTGLGVTGLTGVTGLVGSTGIGGGTSLIAVANVCSTTNLTLSGAQTIDSFSATAGMFCLCAGQTTASQNGYYLINTGAWTKVTSQPTVVPVVNGTANGSLTWFNISANTWNANSATYG